MYPIFFNIYTPDKDKLTLIDYLEMYHDFI